MAAQRLTLLEPAAAARCRHLGVALAAGAASLACLAWGSALGAQSTSLRCMGPEDGYSGIVIPSLVYRHSGDTPDAVAFRARWGLPRVAPSDIALTTDSAVCAAAVAAYDRRRARIDPDYVPPPDSARRVYVWRVGPHYLVTEDWQAAGQERAVSAVLYDSTFTTVILTPGGI